MHRSVHDYVALLVGLYHLAHLPVLEVGSRDVNGSTRDLFSGQHVGVDLMAGPGVDYVDDVERWRTLPEALRENAWPVVVSTEMLEHTPHPWRAVESMVRALQRGGRLIITTRAPGFGIHEFPGDYYRFTAAGLAVLLQEAGLVGVRITPDPDPDSPGVFGTGVKP